MARNYKRDSRGRFAKTGAIGRALKGAKARFSRKSTTNHEKILAQGYSVSKKYTYQGDSRGRARKGAQLQFTRTEYRKS